MPATQSVSLAPCQAHWAILNLSEQSGLPNFTWLNMQAYAHSGVAFDHSYCQELATSRTTHLWHIKLILGYFQLL